MNHVWKKMEPERVKMIRLANNDRTSMSWLKWLDRKRHSLI